MIKNLWDRIVTWLFSWQKEEKDPHVELYDGAEADGGADLMSEFVVLLVVFVDSDPD